MYNDVDKRIKVYLNKEQSLEDKYVMEKKNAFWAKNAQEYLVKFMENFA